MQSGIRSGDEKSTSAWSQRNCVCHLKDPEKLVDVGDDCKEYVGVEAEMTVDTQILTGSFPRRYARTNENSGIVKVSVVGL